MQVYIEYLSLRTLLYDVLKGLLDDEVGNDKPRIHYYIDATRPGKIAANILGKLFNLQIKKLVFEMRHVKDDCGELIRLRIPRKDLFDIQEKIISSDAFRSLRKDEWKHTRVDDFVRKGLIDGSIMDKKSVSRVIFLINVIAWHQQQINASRVKLLLTRRAWWDIYKQYALSVSVELNGTGRKGAFWRDSTGLKGFIRKYPHLYALSKNVSSGRFKFKPAKSDASIPKLYLDGRGDVNLENNGYQSDFFWLLNSEFPPGNVLYDFHSEEEKRVLEHYGIVVANGNVKCISNDNAGMVSSQKKCRRYKDEFNSVRSLVTAYNSAKAYWNSFFRTYGVKVFLTWYKYDNKHMAIADAVKEVGGISAVWQMAFVGFKGIHSAMNTDIAFHHSNWSVNIEQQLGSKIGYHVITGYPKDYATPLLRRQAMDLRAKMKSSGAEKIVLVIDENSVDDSRWHTGHTLQRDNYRFILEKVLKTPWLGVVFKPKTSKTLRGRLGEVGDLLAEAEVTGRCYVYEGSGRHTTSAPPVLAGLSADVCLHGHLSAGTAAVECALEGIPTLLIDREGCPDSKFYELPEGKVIFKNWLDAIDALMEHFKAPQGIPGFGDWSEIIGEFDPFRDGKAANRIGTYLHWLIQGYEKGLNRDVIMADAAQRYSKIWGNDKVISINSV
ncbi:MAG: hypothetical protein HOG49_30335 [Candidatus Scalindua sp.]|nr:hypothetical protein [Candidatus Scalindua sp.]